MIDRSKLVFFAFLPAAVLSGRAGAQPAGPAPPAGVAHATDRVRVPPSWQPAPGRSETLTRNLAREQHFAGARAIDTSVTVHVPLGGGGALIVSRVRVSAPADAAGLAGAVRAELDLVRGAARAAALDGSAVEEISWQERVLPADKLAEASFEWRHPGNQTLSRSRVLIAASRTDVDLVAAECLLRDDLVAQLGAVCQDALMSLTTPLGAAERVPFSIAPAAPAPSVATAPPTPTGGASLRAPPQLSDGSTIALPPTPVAPAQTQRDPRPLYLIGGLAVLAALFLWNRSRRKELERTLARERAAADDPDAEALRDAARGTTRDGTAATDGKGNGERRGGDGGDRGEER